MMIKCSCCGKEIDVEKERQDGLPPMTGFVLDAATFNICADCMQDENRLCGWLAALGDE